MIHFKDKTFCADADQCATQDCHRRLTDDDMENPNLIGLPTSMSSFKEGCIIFTLPNKERTMKVIIEKFVINNFVLYRAKRG